MKTFVDLFSGIGGFHTAGSNLGLKCVFACDIDEDANTAYQVNYGMTSMNDITQIKASDIPDHDVLMAGLPCQSYSVIGTLTGMSDERGALAYDVRRILQAKKPRLVIIENVPGIVTTKGGEGLTWLLNMLESLGYSASWRELNAFDFGVSQERRRIFIVGINFGLEMNWNFPKVPVTPLIDLLESNPDSSFFVSDRVRSRAYSQHTPESPPPLIWNEWRKGRWTSKDHARTFIVSASCNKQLVNGERRLTSREKLRLQGFPDSFKITDRPTVMTKLVGNSVPPPMAQAVLKNALKSIV